MKTVAQLTHDLRDPLSTILMWEQVLRLTEDPAMRERALDAIRDSARAQAAIIDELLAHSRLAR
jgi:signal transduction histidine kinase